MKNIAFFMRYDVLTLPNPNFIRPGLRNKLDQQNSEHLVLGYSNASKLNDRRTNESGNIVIVNSKTQEIRSWNYTHCLTCDGLARSFEVSGTKFVCTITDFLAKVSKGLDPRVTFDRNLDWSDVDADVLAIVLLYIFRHWHYDDALYPDIVPKTLCAQQQRQEIYDWLWSDKK